MWLCLCCHSWPSGCGGWLPAPFPLASLEPMDANLLVHFQVSEIPGLDPPIPWQLPNTAMETRCPRGG